MLKVASNKKKNVLMWLKVFFPIQLQLIPRLPITARDRAHERERGDKLLMEFLGKTQLFMNTLY